MGVTPRIAIGAVAPFSSTAKLYSGRTPVVPHSHIRIQFAWDANPPAQNVLGYTLHIGRQTGVYTDQKEMGNVTTGFYEIGKSGNWFFALTAFNAQGLSPFSNEVEGTFYLGGGL